MSKEAMKLALEALERMTQPVKTNDETQKYKAVTKAITALREALAEQPAQQEPVAWYRDEDGIRIYYESKVWDNATPLYTSPPAQRTWVGLTDEEVRKTINDVNPRNSFIVARDIEAKLKEKNT